MFKVMFKVMSDLGGRLGYLELLKDIRLISAKYSL